MRKNINPEPVKNPPFEIISGHPVNPGASRKPGRKKEDGRKTKKGARKMTKEKEPLISSYPDRDDLDLEIREFLDHFINSTYLQNRLLAEYTKIYSENADFIEKEIARKNASQEKNKKSPDHFD